MSWVISYRRVVKILPWSGFSGIHRKLRIPPNLSSGNKSISGVSNKEPPKIDPSSDEPLTVPPSPGHITQLGTSEVPCEKTVPEIPRMKNIANNLLFIF